MSTHVQTRFSPRPPHTHTHLKKCSHKDSVLKKLFNYEELHKFRIFTLSQLANRIHLALERIDDHQTRIPTITL